MMGFFWWIIAGMTLAALAIMFAPYLKNTAWNHKKILTLSLCGLLFFAAAIALYLRLGSSQLLAQSYRAAAQQGQVEQEIAQLGSLENIIAVLKQRVTENPDGRGWFLLGRLYLRNHQYPLALGAFQEADRLDPNQTEILVSYAEAIYLNNHQSLNKDAQQLLLHALQLQPNQVDALSLLANDAYQQKNYRQAIHYWEQLLQTFPPTTDAGKHVLQMIAAAQKKAAN